MQSCTIPLISIIRLNYKGNKIYIDGPIQKWPVNWGRGLENHCYQGWGECSPRYSPQIMLFIAIT